MENIKTKSNSIDGGGYNSNVVSNGQELDDLLSKIKQIDTSKYIQDAPSDGKTYGRNNGAWSEIKIGVLSQEQQNAILNAINAIPFDSTETTSITQEQLATITNVIPDNLSRTDLYRVIYDTYIVPDQVTGMSNPILSGYFMLNVDNIIMFVADNDTAKLDYTVSGTPSTQGSVIFINPDLSVSYKSSVLPFQINGNGLKFLSDRGDYLTPPNATPTTAGYMSAADKQRVDDAVVFKDVTVAATLTGLSIANYSIKVTLSSASALSFASTPYEGWECMIDIKNNGSSDITQALPNATGWQCDETSITIAAGKIASISVRYVHGTYVVLTKGN